MNPFRKKQRVRPLSPEVLQALTFFSGVLARTERARDLYRDIAKSAAEAAAAADQVLASVDLRNPSSSKKAMEEFSAASARLGKVLAGAGERAAALAAEGGAASAAVSKPGPEVGGVQ